MAITGNDKISLEILVNLAEGKKVKDIPFLFPVSLDQAKRLSRYHNILEKANEHLPEYIIEKIRLLGLKVLYLASFFKMEDWEGLVEILSSVNEMTTRNELPKLILALDEKRNRISKLNQEIDIRLISLQSRQEELEQLEHNLKVTQEKLDQEIQILNVYSENVKLFLINHLGIYEDKLVLSRRLDSNWQRTLKKKGVLQYDEEKYVWYVNDLDKVVEDYIKRINRKTPYPTEWDYEKEVKRNPMFIRSSDPTYRLPSGLASDLSSTIETIGKQIAEVESEKVSIHNEISALRRTGPKSFIESVEAMNTLSVRELKLHGDLQDKALKWLYSRNFVVSSEVILPNGKRVDIIGYDEKGHITIIEVKVSSADFRRDDKWTRYLEYCDEFYFLLTDEVYPIYYNRIDCRGAGLLQQSKNNLLIREPYTWECPVVKDRDVVHFSINKSLSRKFIYGY